MMSAKSQLVNGRTLFDEPPDDGTVGELKKQAVLARLEFHRPRLIRAGRRALLARLLEHGTATADDVRAKVFVPPDTDPRLFGAVPGPLAKRGIIKRAGWDKTRRPDNHARQIMVWQLIDREKALAWLAANPELPEVTEGGGR